MVVHALKSSTGRQRHADLCQFESNLVYRVNSRIAITVTPRNPVLKKEINSIKTETPIHNKSTTKTKSNQNETKSKEPKGKKKRQTNQSIKQTTTRDLSA